MKKIIITLLCFLFSCQNPIIVNDNKPTINEDKKIEIVEEKIKLPPTPPLVSANSERREPLRIFEEKKLPLEEILQHNLNDTEEIVDGERLTFLTLIRNFSLFRIPDYLRYKPEFIKKVRDNLISIMIKNQVIENTNLTFDEAVIKMIEASKINVNFNKSLYFDDLGNLNLLSSDGKSEKIYSGNLSTPIFNKIKTEIAFLEGSNLGKIFVIRFEPTDKEEIIISKPILIPIISNAPVKNIKWFDKENTIAYIADGIYLFDIKNKITTKLTDFLAIKSFNISNDGFNTVFSSTQNGKTEIYTVGYSNNVFQVTKNTGNTKSLSPVFTKDGTRILYTFSDSSSLGAEIYSIKTDGTDNKKLTNLKPERSVKEEYSQSQSYYEIKLSNDGTKIAFLVSTNNDKSINLCTMNIDGSDFKQITNSDYPVSGAFSWAVLENKINYAIKTPEGKTSIYTIDADGTNNKLLLSESGNLILEGGIKSVNK